MNIISRDAIWIHESILFRSSPSTPRITPHNRRRADATANPQASVRCCLKRMSRCPTAGRVAQNYCADRAVRGCIKF
jgi:hypothetical protein